MCDASRGAHIMLYNKKESFIIQRVVVVVMVVVERGRINVYIIDACIVHIVRVFELTHFGWSVMYMRLDTSVGYYY